MPETTATRIRELREIVKRVRAKEELRVLDLFHLPTFKLSPDGKIIYANKKAESSFKMPAKEFVGKHITDVIEEEEDHKAFVKHALEKAKEIREGESIELAPGLVWRRHPSGERVESIARFSIHWPVGEEPRIYASVEHTERVVEKSW